MITDLPLELKKATLYRRKRMSHMECAEKKVAELTTLVLAIYADRFLLVLVVILILVVVSLLRIDVGVM